MFKHITQRKKISVFIVILLVVSFATGSYFNYNRGYAHGYIQGLAEAGDTPTVSPDGIYDMPWVNATAANFDEFYLNSEDKTDLLEYPELGVSYIIFQEGSTVHAKNGATEQIDYSGTASIIQDVIDVVNGTGGGVIFIKRGKYETQINLTDRQNIKIRGEGTDYESTGGTIIRAPDNLDDHLIIIDGTNVYGHRVDITIEDLTLNGASIYQTSGNLVDINDAYGVKIRNCELRQAKDYAIYGRGTLGAAEQITIESNFIRSGGIYVHAGSSWYILNNEIAVTPDKDGITIYSQNSVANTIQGNTIYLCKDGIFVYNQVRRLSIINNKIWMNNESGIDINSGCYDLIISGNIITSNNQKDVGKAGINIRNDVADRCEKILITNNVFDDFQPTPTQTYHIKMTDDTDNITITTNVFGDYATGAMLLVGSNNVIANNIGYVTENSGIETLLNGQTSVVTSHGCDYTPSAGDISVTAIESLGSASYWYVDTITSTQFTIRVNVNPGQDVDFAWNVDRH